MKAITETLWKH